MPATPTPPHVIARLEAGTTAKIDMPYRIVYADSDMRGRVAARAMDLIEAEATVENLKAIVRCRFTIQRRTDDGERAVWINVTGAL